MIHYLYSILSSDSLAVKILPVVIGALLGAWLTRLFNKKRERAALAFEMHREFNNLEMSTHRRKATEVIKRFPDTPIFDLQDKDDVNAISVLIILRFYQRLVVSIKHEQIREKLAVELFYEIFFYWYYVVFKPNLVCVYDWESAKQIEELALWFVRKKSKKEHLITIDKMLQERRKIEKVHAYMKFKEGGDFKLNYIPRIFSIMKTVF